MQEESEKRSLMLEEKLLEMEDRRSRDSQEFQLRMLSILCNRTSVQEDMQYPFQESHPPLNQNDSYRYN
jgi:hypothetical protein